MPLDEVVILDADTNQLETVLDDVANMPSEVGHGLKSALKKTNYTIDDHVSRAFLSAMVCLVGGYRDALRFKAVSVYILPVSHGVSCGRIPGCSQVQGSKCIYPSCQPWCVLWGDTGMLSGSRL